MPTNRSSPQRRAADIAARDRAVMQEIENDQKARYEKSARLRTLRLAKEAADKEGSRKAEAAKLAAAERTIKSAVKKAARTRQRTAVGREDETAERPTQHG